MPSILKRISAFGAYEIFNWLFNNPAYLLAIGYLGTLKGGLLMASFSFIQCATLFVMFDKMGVDWVGVNFLEEVRQKENKRWWERLLSWAVKKEGNLAIISFLIYSVFVDPFVVAVHYRHNHFNGITRRDWGLLFASVAIGNFYWIVRTGLIVEVAKWLWQKF